MPVERESALSVAELRQNAFSPPGRPKGKSAPSGGSKRAKHARRGGIYFGGMRMAPSRRMVSPFNISFVTMLWTSLA